MFLLVETKTVKRCEINPQNQKNLIGLGHTKMPGKYGVPENVKHAGVSAIHFRL